MVIGNEISETDLFHMAPLVCLKFRGIKRTKKTIKKVRDAALSSYVATRDILGEILDNQYLSFSFCYLASHFGLELIDESEVTISWSIWN